MDDSIWNAIHATLFTWIVTAAGAALVFVLPDDEGSSARLKPLLDGLLGFAGGVMVAASYFSLLAPAVDAAKVSATWSALPALPVVLGFALGGGCMAGTDELLGMLGLDESGALNLMRAKKEKGNDDDNDSRRSSSSKPEPLSAVEPTPQSSRDSMRRRAGGPPGAGVFDAMQRMAVQRTTSDMERGPESPVASPAGKSGNGKKSGPGNKGRRGGGAVEVKDGGRWRRIYLLVIAITLHNFPEGLAVGVSFGSAGVLAARSYSAAATPAAAPDYAEPSEAPAAEGALAAKIRSAAAAKAAAAVSTNAAGAGVAATEASKAAAASYAGARSLAIGIALQNFPEGLAVSMPLRREGMPAGRAFFWGQLSGAVEPLGGALGAWGVRAAAPLLPLAMAFAAGAMIYVVVDQLVPEAHAGSPKHATRGFMAGFCLMMAMDLAL